MIEKQILSQKLSDAVLENKTDELDTLLNTLYDTEDLPSLITLVRLLGTNEFSASESVVPVTPV